jgi:hypothetical protein
MTEVVQEFRTTDGLGAMIWKKVYAMSYAYRHKLLFQDTPFEWFLVHESDRVNNREEYKFIMNQFNQLLFNPWSDINFDKITDKFISKRIGKGLGTTHHGPGFVEKIGFLLDAPIFNKVKNDDTNNIVIHLRRGNAIPENPRYHADEFYINLLSQITMLFDKFNMGTPEVIICTDAPDTPKTFKPNDELSQTDSFGQAWMWNQPYLHKDENGEYPVTSANFDEFRKVYPSVKIVNTLSTYDSFLLMLRAKVLITANSAFSQSAGLLSHNRVISINDAVYRNRVGRLDNSGNISINIENPT